MQDHSPSDDAAGPASGDAALDLLRRWCALSALERRVFGALARELAISSDLVESSTLDLSERFQALAEATQAQVGRMDRIVAVASTLVVDGVAIPMDDALKSVDDTLVKAIETILFVSKHAMRMVYTLEDVARDVAGAEQCSGQIEVINRQARYLALNAAIEATRSGATGAAFNVIAQEMKQLSLATETTARQVRERIAAVKSGVGRGHQVLQEIANLDLAQNITAKERIDSLLASIAAQHGLFNEVLADSAAASAGMAAIVGKMIFGMQFQDRTKQHLAQVVETLTVLQETTLALRSATEAGFPGQIADGVDRATLDRIVDTQTLSAMKSRILTELMDGTEAVAGGQHVAAEPYGEIELF